MAQRLSLICLPLAELERCIAKASGAAGTSMPPCDQVRYLGSYLRNPDAGAKTIIVEQPYVDRHWLEEYARYYATMLEAPNAKATRLHFLDVAWTTEQLLDQVALAISRPQDAVLQHHYIGFSVIRPLKAAPIGRTVLRPYQSVPERCFAPARMTHRVHLGGLTLEATGLPFQQQDQGVSACATTALWSALTKAVRTDGGRAPTPFAVTEAATSQHLQSRTFPASAGLVIAQMASAVRAFGYQPHVFQHSEGDDAFALALKTYLRSGIPVVVRARVRDGDLHAFTLVGFRERGESDAGRDLEVEVGDLVRLRGRGVVRWYSHDDRLGAYARLGFDSDGAHPHSTLTLLPTEPGYEHLETPMQFCDAIVPLYPKLRLTAEELISFGVDLSPVMRFLAQDADHLHVDMKFVLGGEYLSQLHKRPLAPERIVRICTTLLLSRYVGVISWYLGGHWILDAVYDTTDLRRSDGSRPPLLALVPREPGWIAQLEHVRSLRFGDGPLIA